MKSILLLFVLISLYSCNQDTKKENSVRDTASKSSTVDIKTKNNNTSIIIDGDSIESTVISSGNNNVMIIDGDTIVSERPFDTSLSNINGSAIIIGNGNTVEINNHKKKKK